MLVEGHRELFRLSHALQHDTESLVYSYLTREAAASTCLAIILGLIARCVHWFLRSTTVLTVANAALVPVQVLSAVQALMLAVVALKQP